MKQVATILGNMAYEIEHCDFKDPIVGSEIKKATLEICQLSQERVDKIFKEIELYFIEVLGHNPRKLEVWQTLKEGLK